MPRAKPKNPNIGQPPFKFTSFPPPIGYINAKNLSSTFVKSDSQSWWSRRDEWEEKEQAKRQKLSDEFKESNGFQDDSVQNTNKTTVEEEAEDDDESATKPADYEVLSKTIIIQPGSRWLRVGRASDSAPVSVPNVIARRTHEPTDSEAPFHSVSRPKNKKPDPALESKLEAIRTDFRSRMRAFKLRGTTNGTSLAAAYNETVDPEVMDPNDDPWAIDWVDPMKGEAYYVGDHALEVPDHPRSGYTLRWPIHKQNLNTAAGYNSLAELMGDIQLIWETVIHEELQIQPRKLNEYSAILIIPDLYEHTYIREMANMMLRTIGFQKVTMQQESVCASFGSGISTACIVNIGAECSTVAAVDEGYILPDTRMKLWFGGDDMNDILVELLLKINFPYHEVDMNSRHDRYVIEQLKESMVTLGESAVALNLYDFIVQRPESVSKKYKVRTYDEVILAPMCLFMTRVIDFEKKLQNELPNKLPQEHIDTIIDIGSHAITGAMKHSTRHLIPAEAPQPSAVPSDRLQVGGEASEAETTPLGTSPRQTPAPEDSTNISSQPGTPNPASDTKPPTRANSPQPTKPSTSKSTAPAQLPDTEPVDISFEASKIPLDVAIAASMSQIGSEERAKRVLSNLLVVGGCSKIPWAGWAIQSRLNVLMASQYVSPPTINIIPPPREIDECNLAWKGVSVLGKLDVSNDLWVRPSDYDALGLRAIRDRCFYFVT